MDLRRTGDPVGAEEFESIEACASRDGQRTDRSGLRGGCRDHDMVERRATGEERLDSHIVGEVEGGRLRADRTRRGVELDTGSSRRPDAGATAGEKLRGRLADAAAAPTMSTVFPFRFVAMRLRLLVLPPLGERLVRVASPRDA